MKKFCSLLLFLVLSLFGNFAFAEDTVPLPETPAQPKFIVPSNIDFVTVTSDGKAVTVDSSAVVSPVRSLVIDIIKVCFLLWLIYFVLNWLIAKIYFYVKMRS